MDRRAYLTALGATVAAAGGCSGGDSTDTATEQWTDAPATATERGADDHRTKQESARQPGPEPSPRVTGAGLLLDAGSFTEFDDIEGVGKGGKLVVGVEYALPVRKRNAGGLVEARVRDSDGTELATDSADIATAVTDDTEFQTDRSWFAFDTEPWATGSYTVDLEVTSDAYGTTATTDVSADIVEPLGPGEVELRLDEFPEAAVARAQFTWTMSFRNRTDRDSSVVADTVTVEPEWADPFELGSSYRQNVPAGERVLVERRLGLSLPGTYTYRIPEIDAEFSFTIEPAE